MQNFRWQPSRPPVVDPRSTGVTFVDVLFALVVGKTLDVSIGGQLPPAAVGHLIVGAVLTITSWVGYHNSINRVNYFLRFWNLPIALFFIDIALVYDYWLIPTTTVHYVKEGQAVQLDTLRVTVLVMVAAFLYVLWDLVALQMRRSGDYPERPLSHDVPSRRIPSYGLLAVAFTVFWVVFCRRPDSTAWAIGVDAVLVIALLAYRTVKEGVTPPGALVSAPASP